jgi:hypothetical protein
MTPMLLPISEGQERLGVSFRVWLREIVNKSYEYILRKVSKRYCKGIKLNISSNASKGESRYNMIS